MGRFTRTGYSDELTRQFKAGELTTNWAVHALNHLGAAIVPENVIDCSKGEVSKSESKPSQIIAGWQLQEIADAHDITVEQIDSLPLYVDAPHITRSP